MGDLNAEPDDPTIAALQGGWLDAWACAHGAGSRGGTWPAIAPYRRIDYVFTQPMDRWAVRACRRVVTASDHLGVLAQLDGI
jgi:endonuclease/exonuclease/phosphatase family metal-dependent hydrolase